MDFKKRCEWNKLKAKNLAKETSEKKLAEDNNHPYLLSYYQALLALLDTR